MSFRRLQLRGFYHDKSADNGEGGGSGSSDEDESGESPAQRALTSLLSKTNGDASTVALRLLEENYRLRSKNRDLVAGQPKQGQVVISAEDAELLTAYKTLGQPDALRQSLTDLEKTKRTEHIRMIADVSGYKSSVLSTLLKDEKIELRKTTTDGKEQNFAVVVADGKETNLADYAKNTWPDFLPALQASTTTSQGSQGGQQLTFPKQIRGESSKVDVVQERINAQREARAKGKNPLIPG